jgi:basic amino acid/polyamine antiporter, APA family
MATSLVMGNMIGSGVFLLPSSLGAFGGISLGGWLISGAGALVLALIFASLSRTLPHAGGPFVYTRAAWGDYPGFLVAWAYWISICLANGAIAVAFVSYSSYLFPVLNQPLVGIATGTVIIWLLTGINCMSVQSGGKVQLITSFLKYIPILALGIFGLFWFDTGHFSPLNTSQVSDVDALFQTATLTLWAFLGLESATVPAGEVIRPRRTIPRATLVGTGLVFLVYVVSFVAIQGILSPEQLAASGAPYADAVRQIWGEWAGKAMGLVAMVATFGALNGWILMGGQVPMAAANQGFLPGVFSRKTATGSPVGALIITAIIATLVLWMDYSRSLVGHFSFLIQLSTLATLFPYVFCLFAEIRILQKRNPGQFKAKIRFKLLLGILALGFVAMAFYGLGDNLVVPLLVIVGSSVAVYFSMRHKRKRHLIMGKGGER